MDPRPSYPIMMAPGASAASPTVRCPGRAEPSRLPGLDEHLVPEDVPIEIIDGQRILAMGKPDHSRPQARLAYVLSPLTVQNYTAHVELTTRADTVPPPPDFDPDAPELPGTLQELRSDASILREGIDPRTGDRYIEELSFEVANEQSLSSLRKKAERLRARGVRRVFGILVKKGQVVEWMPERGEFEVLWPGQVITDPCLSGPLPVKAILDAAAADLSVLQALLAKDSPQLDNAAAQALLDKGNPVIAQKVAQAEARGLRLAVQDLCEGMGLILTSAQHGQLSGMDLAGLQDLRAHLKAHRAWPSQP